MSRRWIIGLSALVVVILGGVAVWYVVLRDDAPPEADLDAVSDGSGGDGGESAAGDGDGDGAAPDTPDGTWTIEQGDTVFVGYRVQEQFAGDTVEKTGAGRTPAVEGTLTVDGDQITAADFTADLTQLSSDQDRRDSALLSRGLQIEQFPQATFELTEPITLPAAPEQGEAVEVTATGNLTLHGQTKPTDIDLEGRWDGATISIAGDTEITFADFGMDPIEIGGFVTTEDHGTLELQLLLVPG
jgi:polyisoprenoid-binding protein YceI